MMELNDQFDSFDELEALVRAAGNVVRASEDLRPRVLETARQQLHERRGRRWVRRLAMTIVMMTTLTASSGSREAHPPLAAALVYPAGFSGQGTPTASGTDINWGMVDGFTEMRRLQAEALLNTAM
jgi:hypothetical protein